MSQPRVPVSFGELLDKITILEIKSERIVDPAKLANVQRELSALAAVWNQLPGAGAPAVTAARGRLRQVNEQLWEIEDEIRTKEAARSFDADFIELARAVYRTNDQRAAIKREVNLALGSELVEEKSYEEY